MGILLALSLCACGDIRQEVTISRGERWKAQVRMVIAPAELAMIGGTAAVEGQLDQLKSDPEAAATNYDWSKKLADDGSVIYLLEQSGEGLDLLRETAFGGDAEFAPVVYDGKDAIQFTFNPQGSFGDLGYYELVLHAGQVLQTNGEKMDKGSVRWVGTGQTMTAILRPSSGANGLALMIGLAALALVIALAVILAQSWRRRSSFQSVAAAPPSFCHQCGAKIETSGKFCPNCGAPRM